MIVVSAIGDITRVGTASQLGGYAGRGAGVHASGQTQRTGRSTKAGRRELRAILGAAAPTAARTAP